MNVQTSIVIDRPIEQVWAYLDDHTHELDWRSPSLKRLNQVGKDPVGVGTRYEGVINVGPGDYPYVNELTRYEPPNASPGRRSAPRVGLSGPQGAMSSKGKAIAPA